MASIPAAEWKRKAVHAAMGLFALTLRWLDWRVAASAAFAALLFNLFVMPRWGRSIYRDGTKKRDIGIVAYSAMVLILIVLFREYRPIAAAVWAMMAFGDPAAAIGGRLIGGPRLPWNPDKSWSGVLADWSLSGLCAVLVFWFVTARPPEPAAAAILLAGAALYAFLESVRSGVDDNLVAALPTALVVYQIGVHWGGFWLWPALGRIGAALAVNVVVASATWAVGIVSLSGAMAGVVVGVLVVVFGGWAAYAVLWAFFLLATAATKLGYRRKARDGVAQADRGRRGLAHVAANVGVPAALLLLGVRPVAYVAALAAALADTLGTEVGGLYGRRPFSLLRFRPERVGMPGAVSFPGIFAGLLGAAVIGWVGFLVRLVPVSGIAIVAAAGLIGSLAESVAHDLGRGGSLALDHDFANAFNTFVGALVALEIVLSLEAGHLFLPLAGS